MHVTWLIQSDERKELTNSSKRVISHPLWLAVHRKCGVLKREVDSVLGSSGVLNVTMEPWIIWR